MKADDGRATAGGGRVAALLAGLVGVLVGALLMSLAHTDSVSPLEIVGLDAFDRHVQELTTELRATARSMPEARASVPAAPAIQPLQPSPSTDLAPLLARLEELLTRMNGSTVAGGIEIHIPTDSATRSARRELFTSDWGALCTAHRLMNYQQVAERYGRPDAIYINDHGQVYWSYLDPEGDAESRTLTFYDGLVVN